MAVFISILGYDEFTDTQNRCEVVKLTQSEGQGTVGKEVMVRLYVNTLIHNRSIATCIVIRQGAITAGIKRK